MNTQFDVIVIGAGHAGCEAASAAARMGSQVLLITLDMNKIAQMSCNPAIGGIAKGQIVREIDALGGQSGLITDAACIQFRMLNRSKGPAMWSPRAQCDRAEYSRLWRHTLEHTPGLRMWQDDAVELLIDEAGAVSGVRTALGMAFHAPAVVLTAGTFLNGMMHFGAVKVPGGRISEPASTGLTKQLRSLGIDTQRMKTGTPVRIDARSIDFSLTTPQDGDNDGHRFSYLPESHPKLKPVQCHILYTNPQTHEVLRQGLPDSPLYNGQIQSIGPRYCPSIETKIVTFADKNEHQLFLEPEGESTTEYYLNGFSSSLPIDVQLRALETIPALRNVHILRPGYAIEYDFFDPTQLYHSLESKVVPGLFMAGQVNGTTGYEEAAGQGLMAGINAHRRVHCLDPVVLRRDMAYIGVLIDDLVTKGVDEPYRMFTSRAEYRILLRQDNADIRLTPLAHSIGLADDRRLALVRAKQQQMQDLEQYLSVIKLQPADANPLLERLGSAPIRQSVSLKELLLRPQVTLADLVSSVPDLERTIGECIDPDRRDEILEATEITVKYRGYIDREQLVADKIKRLEEIRIRGRFDYSALQSLSTEARQKLTRIDPETIAQASRIPGVSPSDINILLLLCGR